MAHTTFNSPRIHMSGIQYFRTSDLRHTSVPMFLGCRLPTSKVLNLTSAHLWLVRIKIDATQATATQGAYSTWSVVTV